MKKYIKPALILERYELSRSIADCGWELNSDSTSTCTATADKGMFGDAFSGTLFTASQVCTYKTDDGYEDYCITNGGNTPFNVFKS